MSGFVTLLPGGNVPIHEITNINGGVNSLRIADGGAYITSFCNFRPIYNNNGFNGNINREDINSFRSQFMSKSLDLAWDSVDFLDNANYYNLCCIPFGANYINIFGLPNGNYIDVSIGVTNKFYNKISQNNFSSVIMDTLGNSSNRLTFAINHMEKAKIFCVRFEKDGYKYVGFMGVYDSSNFYDYDNSSTPYTMIVFNNFFIRQDQLETQIGKPEEEKDPEEEHGPDSTPDGYEGVEDDPTEPTGEPDLPDIGISSIGLVNVYKVTTEELNGFADDLFPTFDLPEPTTNTGLDGVVDNLYNVADTIAKFGQSFINNGLINYVLDCHIVPCLPSIADKTNIKVGFKSFTQQANKVVSDYVEINCGTVNVVSVYKNFLDYVGVRIKLYLPFIGFVDVNPTWCMGGTLKVKYHFNIIDGSCVAFVIGSSPKANFSNTVVATYGGNCCVHVPITGINYSSMIAGVVGTVSKADSSASGISSAVSDALNLVSSKPNLQSSNGYNSGMGFLSYRRPYILVERPVASFSKNYPSEKGLPCNITYKLSDLKGFTVCENVRITNNTGILQREEQMIIEQLRNGIIL